METAARKVSFADEGRIALSVRLPRMIHVRMREIALRRDVRVNDLYQTVLEDYIEAGCAGEPFLRAPPLTAQPVTLWLTREFTDRFRRVVDQRQLAPTNIVLTALLDHFGVEELLRA